ncbi:hypothetical protein SHIRM173S_08323 [Streptomyces hirsutus]
MVHYRRTAAEALWWWQFSYFSNWGSTASAALRALQSVVAHVRLNQPLAALDGLDTDQGMGDDTLEIEAGRVTTEGIGTRCGVGGINAWAPGSARRARESSCRAKSVNTSQAI